MALAVGKPRMADDQVHHVHPFFLSSRSRPPQSSLAIAEGPSSKRDRADCEELSQGKDESAAKSPKRRRTVSPEAPRENQQQSEAHEDWRRQLQIAAYTVGDLEVVTELDGTSDTRDIPPVDVPGEQQTQVTENELITDKNQVTATATALDTSADPNSTFERLSPKRKMLKLSSDGKLGSPSSRVSKGAGKTRGRRKKADPEQNPNSKMAILRYGTDDLSRADLGAKIRAIFSGLAHNPVELLPSTQQIERSNQPPKPTHPFFLAKAQPPSKSDVTTLDYLLPEESARENAAQGHNRSLSPQKKPLVKAGQAAATWASLAGFGRGSTSSATSNLSRLSGLIEPLWPPRELVHVRGEIVSPFAAVREEKSVLASQKKLKALAVQISETEDVLEPYIQLIHQSQAGCLPGNSAAGRDTFNKKPIKKLMTGHELQQNLQQKVRSTLSTPSRSTQARKDVGVRLAKTPQDERLHEPPHSAVSHVFESIPRSQSAFDRFACEAEEWIHKYAPKSAVDVLQQGREVLILRDWLKTLTVASVQNGNGNASKSRGPLNPLKQGGTKKRRKRKRADELADFLISSDEEASEMGELSGPEDSNMHENSKGVKKSLIRALEIAGSGPSSGNSIRSTNAVVISGPHGCGKTAAVYAVAEELGFEVFEINPGSRRSGKDLLDKVGDMTRNHLVHRASDPGLANETAHQHDESLQKDLESGRQSTMKGFFKSKSNPKKSGNQARSSLSSSSKSSELPKKPNHQKQSLILLEEVDILFEEDKQFWTTALGMISQSKRPIIMTCTDESRLPIEDMALHAILRFQPPSDHLVADYLVLVAGSEGHLLDREAISTLYESNNSDLRATITGLNFWCQMGIGDDKGGLEWMPIPSSLENNLTSLFGKQRVISENTFVKSMGQPPSLYPSKNDLLNQKDLDYRQFRTKKTPIFNTADLTSHEGLLEALKVFDIACDAVSFADVFPGSRLPDDIAVLLDTTLPDLPENASANYIEGFPLLQADPIQDLTGLTIAIPIALRACSRSLLYGNKSLEPIKAVISDWWPREKPDLGSVPNLVINERIRSAFSPLCEAPNMPSFAFLAPLCQVVEDIAPYVRAIVSYDQRLEARRLHLSSLLSQGGAGGKRQRTTRASRAALEGGNKSNTRRERWFPRETNFPSILRTGGSVWQEAALQLQGNEGNEPDAYSGGSRRSSVADMGADD